MVEGSALVPQREQEIEFYGDAIRALLLESGEIVLPVRQMCDHLGVGYQGQIDRIRRDAVLQKYERQVAVATEKGGTQPTNCLALKVVPGWLFGINARRVRAAVREKLVRYQEEVYDVIWEAFRGEVEPVAPPDGPLDDLAVIEQMGLAIYRLARQQRTMEARIDSVEDALWEVDERTRGEVARLGERLSALELRLPAPARSRSISEPQAAELSQAVKTVALALGARSGRNEFGAIYGELYRRFGITSYRNLPATAFDDAMAWLQEWFRSLPGEDDEST